MEYEDRSALGAVSIGISALLMFVGAALIQDCTGEFFCFTNLPLGIALLAGGVGLLVVGVLVLLSLRKMAPAKLPAGATPLRAALFGTEKVHEKLLFVGLIVFAAGIVMATPLWLLRTGVHAAPYLSLAAGLLVVGFILTVAALAHEGTPRKSRAT